MNHLHGKKPYRLAGCPGQVDRVPRVGGLPCLACKRLNVFSIETYEKLALPRLLGSLHVNRLLINKVNTISQSDIISKVGYASSSSQVII